MAKHRYHNIINSSNLEDEMIHCPICGSVNLKNIGMVQKQPKIDAVQCNKCHVGFATRLPTDAFLNNYYSDYYDKAEQRITIDPHSMSNHLLKLITPIDTHADFNILDFGGGDGTIAIQLGMKLLETGKIKKINIHVIDPNVRKSDVTHPQIQMYYLHKLDTTSKIPQMDLVLASAILEHLKNPKAIISQLLALLDKNGLFYARTPYFFPIKKLFAILSIHLDMLFPQHLFDMGNKFWYQIPDTLNLADNLKVVLAQPSIVQTRFKDHFLGTLLAYLLKLPGYLWKKHYHFVGGWEILIRNTDN